MLHYDPDILSKLQALPDCAPGDDAETRFATNYREVANFGTYLRSQMTQLIRHYGLDQVGIPLPAGNEAGNYDICFHHFVPEIVDVERPDGTSEKILQVARASTEKELFDNVRGSDWYRSLQAHLQVPGFMASGNPENSGFGSVITPASRLGF
ncbi:hypothetical protein Ddc_14822 [Ditylenchus destructor]|nr:hypothetical protein Ddc_14822 [Ditylenchus destructor]